MFRVVVLASLVLSASACSSAGGQITSTPKFSFSFFPPVSWTFTNNLQRTTPGQWNNTLDARRMMKNDIDSAISAAVKKNGYEGLLGSASYTTGGYNADIPFPIGTAAGEYLVELGAVTKQIPPPTPAPSNRVEVEPAVEIQPQIAVVAPNTATIPNTQEFQLNVTNSAIAFPTDQWSKIARDVYTILSVQYKVRFVSDIRVGA